MCVFVCAASSLTGSSGAERQSHVRNILAVTLLKAHSCVCNLLWCSYSSQELEDHLNNEVLPAIKAEKDGKVYIDCKCSEIGEKSMCKPFNM